ncbi:hypothetical protein, partial [Vreelandella hamiltonii]|uniref:hypothetical protein n=1 Tax=Vreelandella hamiltonii TaxID=502829 RepID=UPI001E5A1409
VGHGTVWVNGDNGYIAMQVSGLEVLPGAGLTDSGLMGKRIKWLILPLHESETDRHLIGLSG